MTVHEFFKDFSGPLSTSIAAIAAAVVAAIFAHRQARAAELQADIARSRLQFDTFAIRQDIPNAVHELARYILSQGRREDHDEYIKECIYRIDQARYYYPPDVVNKIISIKVRLIRLDEYYARENSAKFPQRVDVSKRIDAMADEVVFRTMELPEIFEPYLSIGGILPKDTGSGAKYCTRRALCIIVVLEVLIIFLLAAIAVAGSQFA